MSEENLEEWDASFLEELIQVEELALSCSYVNQNNRTSSSSLPPPSSSHQQPLHFPPPPSRTDSISYSPPRELSQRPTDLGGASNSTGFIAKCATPSTPVRRGGSSANAKDIEIELLKKELGRVSKQLADLEHECSELKKERSKEHQLTVANSNNEAKVANLEDISFNGREHGVPVAAHDGFLQEFPNRKSFKDQIGLHKVKSSCQEIGVQTDLNASLDLSEKLQDIWGLPSEQKFGRNLISKLFAVCSEDVDVLCGFINRSLPSKTMELHAVKNSADMALKSSIHPFLSAEAAKVSRFHSALTKITSGMLQLQALFESLFDLCTVENVVIIYRSLHILHVLLKHLLTFERESRGRENFLIEHLHSGSGIDDIFGYETRDRFCIGMDGTFPSCMPTGVRTSEAKYLCKKGRDDTSSASLFSHINWICLFEFMRLIVMKSSEECVRLEAVSIMNAILLRSDAYTEREKFGLSQVFESISQLLRKEAGLLVQKEAVHALYLLLNCPQLLVTFCSGCTTEASADAANDKENTTAIQGFTMILEGLADCIACPGNSLQALELRKDAIILLAFVASSGKSGFEILVNNKLSREANFLTLIMQLLASEVDLEATLHTQSDETFRARTLLIREVLILLNRLVSNPAQSATVLRLLTNSRDMVSLTIDVASRLSRKEPKLRLSSSIAKQMRESEIVDLGRMFKRRVSTYLGE
ncbi:SENSITIVE TO UV 2 [Hibiscus trionum]|uniref:SENSITIVE TO UV 2 n=1 Tax=Hibiscus trionum TaxID=183268 RepID=A0A9W7IUI2_HIBTR|nr:SENSITIVE TO UV 2 [Hibiscus trionum]